MLPTLSIPQSPGAFDRTRKPDAARRSGTPRDIARRPSGGVLQQEGSQPQGGAR